MKRRNLVDYWFTRWWVWIIAVLPVPGGINEALESDLSILYGLFIGLVAGLILSFFPAFWLWLIYNSKYKRWLAEKNLR